MIGSASAAEALSRLRWETGGVPLRCGPYPGAHFCTNPYNFIRIRQNRRMDHTKAGTAERTDDTVFAALLTLAGDSGSESSHAEPVSTRDKMSSIGVEQTNVNDASKKFGGKDQEGSEGQGGNNATDNDGHHHGGDSGGGDGDAQWSDEQRRGQHVRPVGVRLLKGPGGKPGPWVRYESGAEACVRPPSLHLVSILAVLGSARSMYGRQMSGI